MGRYSVVSMGTCYSLVGLGIEPRWGQRFSCLHTRPDSTLGPLNLCAVGTYALSRGRAAGVWGWWLQSTSKIRIEYRLTSTHCLCLWGVLLELLFFFVKLTLVLYACGLGWGIVVYVFHNLAQGEGEWWASRFSGFTSWVTGFRSTMGVCRPGWARSGGGISSYLSRESSGLQLHLLLWQAALWMLLCKRRSNM